MCKYNIISIKCTTTLFLCYNDYMQFYQSNLLNQFPNLQHAFTTKVSGNLAFHVGDTKENVLIQHATLAKELHYTQENLVFMNQIHSNNVYKVTQKDSFSTPPTADALITDRKNTPLMVMVADCTPVMFYDNKHEVIAVAHVGRAGALKNIIHNVLQSFQNDFGSNLADIYVATGASICQNCYEVGEEIAQEVQLRNMEYAISTRNAKYYLDIESIIQKQLLYEGIQQTNIEFCPICNACNTQHYFSYRKEGQTGRFAGMMMLIE